MEGDKTANIIYMTFISEEMKSFVLVKFNFNFVFPIPTKASPPRVSSRWAHKL